MPAFNLLGWHSKAIYLLRL